jgi:hypothetical protein
VEGFDVRVHCAGGEVHACRIVSDAVDYRYAVHQVGSPAALEPYELDGDLATRCLALTDALGLELSGIDLRLDGDGRAWCFEVNPPRRERIRGAGQRGDAPADPGRAGGPPLRGVDRVRPTAADLAEAPPADVLRAWVGLGFNRRALRLREACTVVARDGWPEDLTRLPGVGAYTAAALGAFAFGRDEVAMDTNLRGRSAARGPGDAAAGPCPGRTRARRARRARTARLGTASLDCSSLLSRPLRN